MVSLLTGRRCHDSTDSDSDGIEDDCDNCPQTANLSQLDSDLDGAGNLCDNCPDVHNPDQLDTDGNGIGDVCCCNGDGLRGNVDDIGEVNIADLTYLVSYLYTGGSEPPCMEESDIDGNVEINIADLTYLVSYLFTGGPAPVACP
ncbi:MAG: thrombospondin type 3 repeat-containing protein [candidate division Zixibacteria bacterium]|nr:thrombospondin type 3 repeat-containing protein [candidate division Zixibacteria bacterium]